MLTDRYLHKGSTNQTAFNPFTAIRDEYTTADPMPWDDSDPFVSARAREVVKMVTKCYVRQFLVFIGAPGNVISAIVFKKQGLSDRIHLLLFSLAIADFSNLMSHLLLIPDCYFTDPVHISNWLTVVNAKMASVSKCTNFITGTHIVLVNVDRCLSVALPLRARTLLTYRRLVVAILLLYIGPPLLFLPSMVAFKVTWRTDPLTNRSLAYMENSNLLPGGSRLTTDITRMISLVHKPVFLIIMIACSTITVVSLHRASHKRTQMTGKSTTEGNEVSDNRITKTLLFLCFVYIGLTFPEVCSDVAVFIFPEYYIYRKYHNTLLVFYRYIWVASCLNSTVNFFAYLVLSSAFRKTLKNLCNVCCIRTEAK